MSSQIDLQAIFNSGDVTLIKVGGAEDGKTVVVRDELAQDLADGGYLKFKGPWINGSTYLANDCVTDSGWTMVANKTTIERPAPAPIGGVVDIPGEPDPVFTELDFTGMVRSGHKYTLKSAAWLSKIEVFLAEVTGNYEYRFYVANITDPNNPIVTIIESPPLTAGAWTNVWVGSAVAPVGAEFLVVAEAFNSSADTTITGQWTFNGNSQAGAPTCPGGWNRDNGGIILRMCKTDFNSADRSADLATFIAGTTISFVVPAVADRQSFLLTSNPTDQGTYYQWDCELINSSGTVAIGDTCDLTATVPTPTPTKYMTEANYWTTNPEPDLAEVEGYLTFNGVVQPAVDASAFGVRISLQEANISDDWQLLAYSGALGSGGSTGEKTYDYQKESAITVVDDTWQECARLTTPFREDGTYEVGYSLTYTLDNINTSAYFRYSVDGGSIWNEVVKEPKDSTDSVPMYYAYPFVHSGAAFDIIFQARKEAPTDVMTINFLDLWLDKKK